MRLVIARCTVDYTGRLTAHLPEAIRLIMVKADGTLAVHSDGNASKPLNWMVAPNVLETFDDRWEVSNSKGERLTIWIDEVLEDVTHALGDDPGLQKDGVEAHLQQLLGDRPWVLEEGLTLIRREYPTDIGPVDLLCSDVNGRVVAVEIKRRGRSTAWSNSLDISNVLTTTRVLPRSGGYSQHSRSLLRRGSWPKLAGSRRSRWTTTVFARQKTPSCACSRSAEVFDVVFFRPEIPPNTGNAMRLAAVSGCRLHLIEPLGFEMDDARVRRAGMDYRDKATVAVHPDLDAWRQAENPERVFALTVDAETIYCDASFREGDAFLFGPESVGLPDDVKNLPWITEQLRLPMVPDVRSLNLSNSAAVVVYEAWRQLGFIGSRAT